MRIMVGLALSSWADVAPTQRINDDGLMDRDNKKDTRADHLKEHHGLYHHVLECMRNHTTYFMLSNISVMDGETNVEGKEDSIVAAMIVEKNVIMTEQEKTRALIHYICVDPDLRRTDFSTVLTKSVFVKMNIMKGI